MLLRTNAVRASVEAGNFAQADLRPMRPPPFLSSPVEKLLGTQLEVIEALGGFSCGSKSNKACTSALVGDLEEEMKRAKSSASIGFLVAGTRVGFGPCGANAFKPTASTLPTTACAGSCGTSRETCGCETCGCDCGTSSETGSCETCGCEETCGCDCEETCGCDCCVSSQTGSCETCGCDCGEETCGCDCEETCGCDCGTSCETGCETCGSA